MQCRIIEGYEDYIVFEDGQVYSKRSERMLNPYLKGGYVYVDLSKDGETIHFRVHRLVAKAFLPNPENKPEINHKNGIKTDNRVENIEWVTPSENMIHAVYSGLVKPPAEPRYVSQYTKAGDFIATYRSIMDAQRATGVSHGHISDVCIGNRKSAGGYTWRYQEVE